MKLICVIFQGGLFFCVVSFVTGARFQGSMCKTREEAAESAASVALLQMVCIALIVGLASHNGTGLYT